MKKIVIIALFLLGLVFLNLKFVNAVTTENKVSEKTVCLYRIWCYDNKDANPDWSQINQCTQKNGHRVRLTSKEDSRSEPKSETYIVDCVSHKIATQIQPVITCTTGNSSLDIKLFESDHFTYLKNLIGYNLDLNNTYGVFNVDKQPYERMSPPKTVMTNEIGNIPIIEWQIYTPKGYDRKFYAINILSPVQNPNGSGLGQKLANILTSKYANETCLKVGWDPEGRVFDAITLEPIPDVDVNLLKKYNTEYRDARETELGISNPFITDSDGGFTFIVNDGNYKLNPVAANYSFPVDSLDKISVNYKNIYSSIYPAQSGAEIIQKGKLEHRDIALMPNNANGYTYDLKVLSFFNELNKSTGQIVLEGKVSHPLAKINVYSLKSINNSLTRNRIIFSNQADKMGKFNFKINTSILTPEETYGDIEFIKVDLTGENTSVGQPVSFQFDSIPNYLEGFAYDNYGNKLVNAQVKIYSDIVGGFPLYQTTTDNNGYYKITSEYLPSMPFKIKYSTIQSIEINPNQFVIKNNKYLVDNKINLNNYKASTEAAKITRVPSLNPTDNFAREKIGGNNKNINQASSKINSSAILIIAVILLLIGGVGAMLGIYALHKKQQPPTI